VYTEIGTYKASLIVFNLSLYNDSLPPEKRLDPIIDSKQVTITVNDVEGNETNETNNTNTTQNNGVVVSHFESNATALIINDFVTTPTSGTVPLHTNSVSNITHLYPIKCWKWDFEPVGCDQYSQHPETAVHTFTHVGLFDLRLTVIDCKGNVAIMQKTNYVNVTAPVVTENNTCHPKPSSSCTPAKPSSSCSPAKPKTSCSTSSQFKLKGHQNCKVNIKCSTKTKVDGCTVNYGDGKGTHCLTSTHTYTKCGTYTVTVTAKNSSGCTVKKVVGTVTID
jgi:PKD repeat protein